MKLHLISNNNINSLNGAVAFLRLFIDNKEFFTANGIDVSVNSNSCGFQNEQEYVKSIKYGIKNKIKSILNHTVFGKKIKYKYYLNLGKRVIKQIPKTTSQADFYLLNDEIVAYNFFKRMGNSRKTIFMMHNNGELNSMTDSALLQNKRFNCFLQKMEKVIFCSATYIVFVSQCAKNYFDNKYPEYRNKTRCIHIGLPDVNINAHIRSYDTLRLVTVGTIGDRKNQIAILKALNKIDDKSIFLTVVGGGPRLDDCKSYVKEMGMDKQVRFTGAQNDVNEFLTDANLFIMTSTDEGLPISAQEALRAHLPLLLTNVGGCSELIKDNGLLVELDESQIVGAIEDFNFRKNELYDMGEKSYQIFVEYFSINKMLNKYISLIS